MDFTFDPFKNTRIVVGMCVVAVVSGYDCCS